MLLIAHEDDLARELLITKRLGYPAARLASTYYDN
jgi:hypothetical protein